MKKIFTTIFAVLFTLPALAADDNQNQTETNLVAQICKNSNGHITCRETGNTIQTHIECDDGFKDNITDDIVKKKITGFCNKPDNTITITGTVKDENGPLPGATISVGNTDLTSTDTNGQFSVKVTKETEQIQISFIGFEPKTVDVQENMGTITLTEASLELKEITSYGCTVTDIPHATAAAYDIITQKCYLTKCESARYKLINPRSVQSRNDGKQICIGSAGEDGSCEEFCENDDCTPLTIGDECEDQVGKECTPNNQSHVDKAKYEWDGTNLKCVIKKCDNHYLPSDDGTVCELSEGDCTKDQLEQIEHATAGELKNKICHATACDGGYEPSDGKCVAISGDCDPMPEHATAAHREWDTTTNTEICIIDRCGNEYRPSNDRRSCIRPTLTEEESQKKIDELQKNADAMRETEQSTANKLLGGASIAATGIGGMQLASAIAENRADDAAERDMAAYLATFRCDYGQGRNIMGGETDVQLPGGNNLIELKQQFMELATDLKTRKDALEMTPGIESEVILDSATMGLYDDESLGITDGAYTSLARALSDPDGADAAEWAQQRSDTKSQLTTGAVMAGVGIVGGVVGNLLINRDAPDEKSDEINLKYEPLKKLRDDTLKLPDNTVGAQCPSDATGTYPDCECTDTKHVYNGTANKCEECTGDKVAITSTTCGCPDGTISSTDDTCIERQTGRTPECNPDTPNIKVDLATGKCLCINGYILTDAKTCECPDDTHKILQNGVCVEKTGQQITIPECAILPAENLFALNSAQLTDGALLAIGEFAGDVKNAQGDDKIYCITVNGYTDTSGTETYNQRLSTQRAEAVKTALIKAKIPETNIQANGYGETNCKYENGKLVPDGIRYKNCRRVEIGFSPNACQ